MNKTILEKFKNITHISELNDFEEEITSHGMLCNYSGFEDEGYNNFLFTTSSGLQVVLYESDNGYCSFERVIEEPINLNVAMKEKEVLMEKVKNINTFSDMNDLGFSCEGMLCNFVGHEEEYERNWLCTNSDGLQAVINDAGNDYASFVRFIDEPIDLTKHIDIP